MTSRTYTIRGKLTCADGELVAPTITGPTQILSYSSVDRTKAWKLRAWWVWPITVRAETGTTDGQLQMDAALWTDTKRLAGASAFNMMLDPTENRSVGWLQAGYKIEADASGDFLASQSRGEMPRGIIDEDRLITDNLFISLQTSSASSVKPSREWGFMVVLDQVKVSPLESVVQQLKGVGQDLEN